MKLHLGVVDLPYSTAAPVGRKKRNKRPPNTQTTGDVAGWLEDDYHPMEIFAELHGPDIANDLAGALAGALESQLMGAPVDASMFAAAESAIDDRFKRFLSDREMEGMGFPGVPTQAALNGTNRRMKSKRGVPRPSFIDTGLYQSSFKSWVE